MDVLVPSGFERATQSLAGGVDSPVRAGVAVGGPPPAIAAARGSRVYDTSGRAYIDYVCAYGPVLLGHADPRIRAAVHQALAHGAVFGATHPDEIRLAERIQQHLPSMQRLRFVSTGTEACMSAIRVARSFTKREKFVRFAGNYHGHSDEMIFSAGASSNSAPKVDCGVTQAAVGDVHVLPYNDLTSLEKTLTLHGDEIAAVILEPVVGNMGLVEPLPGYLESVRAACDRFGVLLIFDEVITGFRLGLGGAQERFGVRPDLTCLGKTLGGGLPIAAFGGRADVMDQLAPAGSVFQGGTFSGNPVCVAAANAFLDALESDPLLHERLGRLARRLAAGLRDGLVGAQLTCPVVQCASIVDFMFRAGGPHQDYEQAREADPGRYARYYWAMLERGINLAPSQMEVMFLTASHTEADVDETVAAMHEALQAAAQRTDGVARSLR